MPVNRVSYPTVAKIRSKLTFSWVRLPEPIVNQLSESGTLVIPKIDQWSANTGFSKTGLAHQPASTSREVFGANEWVRILDPPSHPEMLGRIDEFEVESKIGQGGMGIVLKGFDRELNRAVAIKILLLQIRSRSVRKLEVPTRTTRASIEIWWRKRLMTISLQETSGDKLNLNFG